MTFNISYCTFVTIEQWYNFGEYRYYFGTTRGNWFTAKAHCESEPFRKLATTQNQATHDYLIGLLWG